MKRRADGIDTTAALRGAIDRGESGDKISAPDPAAAPLGTDDEAAGAPAPRSAVRLAASNELRRGVRDNGDVSSPFPYFALVAAVVAAGLLVSVLVFSLL